jgi:DNA modification methylase
MLVEANKTVRVEIGAKARRRREHLRETALAQSSRTPRNDLLPTLKVVSWPIERLQPPARSVRKLIPAQVERIKTSFKAFGVVQPILIRSDGEIVKGRTCVEAAKQLGLAEVPCIVVDHLTEPEVRALRIALSRLPELGEWDFDALHLEMQELIELDAPIDALGFSLQEIDGLAFVDEAEAEVDRVPPPTKAPPVTKLGQVWRLGKHRIVCGDSLDPATYATLLGDEQVRLVLTDVPFNVPIKGHVTSGDHAEFAMAAGEMTREQFEAFNAKWMAECMSRLAPGGLLATFIDWRSIELILAAGRGLGLDLLNLIVWAKTNAGQGSLWRSRHELLPVFKKPGASHTNNVELGKHGRWRSNVWEYPGASSLGSDARDGLADHPTVKPVALLEDGLLDVTNIGDLILEPFAGSGSTLIACETTHRRCRAIELEPTYVDVVVNRWQAFTDKLAIDEETGATFDEIAGQAGADFNLERGGV